MTTSAASTCDHSSNGRSRARPGTWVSDVMTTRITSRYASPGAGTHDQIGRPHPLPVRGGNAAQQGPGGAGRHLLDRLSNRAHGWVGTRRQEAVIESDESNVVRHPPPGLGQSLQGADRHEVTRYEESVDSRVLGQQSQGRATSDVAPELAAAGQRNKSGVPDGAQI